MIDWIKSFFRLSLHPCDVCKQMMRANGYGICDECLEIIDYGTKDEFYNRIK